MKLTLEEDGKYICIVAESLVLRVTLFKIDKRLLNDDFACMVIDADDRFGQPKPEPELLDRA